MNHSPTAPSSKPAREGEVPAAVGSRHRSGSAGAAPTPAGDRGQASRDLTVADHEAGRRLDRFLCGRLGLSRREARQLLAGGAVVLRDGAGRDAVKGTCVAAGQVWRVAGGRDRHLRVVPEPGRPLSVLAMGDGCVAVDKPAGVPVHPLRDGERGTLLNAVVARWPCVAGIGEGGLRSGVVHRLDVDTSGAVLFAIEQAGWVQMRAALAEHRAEKVYQAVVAGRLEGGASLEAHLVVACHRPARVRVVDPADARRRSGTRRCSLAWRALEHAGTATHVEVRLHTGFLHQIRVMLAHAGHPVLGDPVYGGADEGRCHGAARQMLHATRLRIGSLTAASPLPADMAALLERLRGA